MAIQMIICLETNKRADTDGIYIRELLNYLYKLDNKTKLSMIHMNTKSRYNAKGIIKEIKEKINDFKIGESKVIYCIDTDQYEKNAEHAKELETITEYCKDNNYDLIWFCHDVEEVFLGEKIADSKKVEEAKIFKIKGKIKNVPFKKLSSNKQNAYKSNILLIFDKYLNRK